MPFITFHDWYVMRSGNQSIAIYYATINGNAIRNILHPRYHSMLVFS